MKSKIRIGTLLVMSFLFISQASYGSETNKKEELERIVTEAEDKGAVIDINYENIDYESLNLENIETELLMLTSIPKEIILDPINIDENNSNIMPAARDEYVKVLTAQYKYRGDKDINGRSYRYDTIIHVDYDCLFNYSGKAIRIEKINDAYATQVNYSFGVSFSQKGSIIPTRISDSQINLRGKGRYTVGVGSIGGAHYDVEYFCTVRAGNKGVQY